MTERAGPPGDCIVIHSRTATFSKAYQEDRILKAKYLTEKYSKNFKWILMADNITHREMIRKQYPDNVVTLTDAAPIHTQVRKGGTQYKSDEQYRLLQTFGEFYMLGYCNIIIRGISGFSTAAEWMHGLEKVRDREVHVFGHDK
eukprot:TRINITY_DN781_c0_g1_i3.p1 TRINITY_DN781_c0_g1~~TRINITY_DN781_c0_g1_i3.p1  ORF type:complete len:144 (+),score=10.64 TRINITY_DN781_c0_g1_i3:237-668(+)